MPVWAEQKKKELKNNNHANVANKQHMQLQSIIITYSAEGSWERDEETKGVRAGGPPLRGRTERLTHRLFGSQCYVRGPTSRSAANPPPTPFFPIYRNTNSAYIYI